MPILWLTWKTILNEPKKALQLQVESNNWSASLKLVAVNLKSVHQPLVKIPNLFVE